MRKLDTENKWIMLTKKLPTVISPPKLSMHYSKPSIPDRDEIITAYSKFCAEGEREEYFPNYNIMKKEVLKLGPTIFTSFGKENNPCLNRDIYFMGETLKVLSHEYTIITIENFKIYYPECYNLIPDTFAQETFFECNLSKGQRFIYEAALVDGCDEYQALQVATGKNIDDFPAPVGWFKIIKEYGMIYCTDEDLEITDNREEKEMIC